MQEAPQPPLWRVLAAFVGAPFAAALLLAWVQPAYDGLPSVVDRIFRTFLLYLIIGAFQPTVLVGLPTYLVLRRQLWPTPLNCALAGAAVASLPWLLLAFILPGAEYSVDGGHITVEHGYKTVWGWLELGTASGWLALLGAFAGLVFWVIAAAGWKGAPKAAMGRIPPLT
jgi:hypothetical protein